MIRGAHIEGGVYPVCKFWKCPIYKPTSTSFRLHIESAMLDWYQPFFSTHAFRAMWNPFLSNTRILHPGSWAFGRLSGQYHNNSTDKKWILSGLLIPGSIFQAFCPHAGSAVLKRLMLFQPLKVSYYSTSNLFAQQVFCRYIGSECRAKVKLPDMVLLGVPVEGVSTLFQFLMLMAF